MVPNTPRNSPWDTQSRGPISLATTTSSAPARISPALATLILLIALNLLNYIDRYILPGELSLIQTNSTPPVNRWARLPPPCSSSTCRRAAHRMARRPLPAQAPHHRRRCPVEPRNPQHNMGARLLDALLPPRHRRHRRSLLRHLRPGRHRRLLP